MRAALKVKALTSDSAKFIDGARICAAEVSHTVYPVG